MANSYIQKRTISDGTNELKINTDGSINSNSTPDAGTLTALNNIATNTASTAADLVIISHQLPSALNAGGNLKVALSEVTAANQVPVNFTAFDVSVEITRSSTTTAYAANQLINGNGASTLPALDLSGIIGAASRKLMITSCVVLSSNGGASVKLLAQVHLYKINNPQTVTDYTAFNPTYANIRDNRAATFEDVSVQITNGANASMYAQTDVTRLATTDSGGKLYAALVASNAYTPANGETITISIKGYILN